ncbi:hypothetical protein BO70DRAFT_367304 [Aspergillus heteromorphus CBS 117.55]|uniref:Uncharacterized protein n=1 Tax=Aspergillus heteromorphus CBS 117.55 TaxID=1448321 RepID=A0A317X084_9EURO|nr:uncharacterized protein BO70DRAFT_367304 [Aspergillus heteromorphus CBS 117.55]PWY92056.1 hypothetical protein BO70DRAFT_367304 [Aspergillus heteromorphus CBS 117.55]
MDMRDFTDDEEEVLYDLDETALAQLPQHLQDNMRQLQLERMYKLQDQYTYTDPHISRPSRPTPYAESWFQNMMMRLSADQEMSEAHDLRNSPSIYEEDVTWGMIQRQWTTTTQREMTERDLRASLQFTDDWFSNHATVASDDFSSYPSASSRATTTRVGGMLAPVSNDMGCQIYQTEVRESSDRQRLVPKASARVRKRNLSVSIITHMRCRVRKSVQKLSKFLKK